MKMTRKQAGIMALASMMLLSACSSGSKGEEASAPQTGPIKIVWWHSLAGANGKVLEKMTDDFNKSQTDVQVEAVFQGEYDDSYTKLFATLNSNSGPVLYQSSFDKIAPLIDSESITPVQQFIDKEKYDMSQFEKTILSAYTYKNALYSMPFNSSNAIMYYNKDMFKQAGLDPNKPPATYDELIEMAKKLTGNGKFGVSFSNESWFVEQFMAAQGAERVDNGNGRLGQPTKSLINGEGALSVFNMWRTLRDNGSTLDVGGIRPDTQKAFFAGQAAMILASTAGVKNILTGSKDKFELGTAPLPKPANAKPGGSFVSGGSLYIMNNKPKAEQEAAWKFIKFMMKPDQQAYLSVNTGYFPVTTSSYALPEMVENLKTFPQFKTAIDQLASGAANNAASGSILGVYPQEREVIADSLTKILKGADVKQTLDEAAKQITAKIVEYNNNTKKK
jgi:sn-glycerol 3-phosphate transport system substrate-binding protein